MIFFLLLIDGALFCNCIPHLVRGVQGVAFPTPFAKPPGVGDSSPLVNVLWGSLNLFIAVYILRNHALLAGSNAGLLALAIGFLASGIFLARHFGKVMLNRPSN